MMIPRVMKAMAWMTARRVRRIGEESDDDDDDDSSGSDGGEEVDERNRGKIHAYFSQWRLRRGIRRLTLFRSKRFGPLRRRIISPIIGGKGIVLDWRG